MPLAATGKQFQNASTSTWRDINYNFSSDKHAGASILISPVADLSARISYFLRFLQKKKKKGKICDILPRCKQYFMRWAGRKWQPSTAPPTQVNSPAWGAEGKKVICEETDLPGWWRVLLCWSPPHQESWESRAYGDTLTGNWGECRPIWRLCVNLK